MMPSALAAPERRSAGRLSFKITNDQQQQQRNEMGGVAQEMTPLVDVEGTGQGGGKRRKSRGKKSRRRRRGKRGGSVLLV